MIKCLIFISGLVLIAKIEELEEAELGDPDCQISDVCVVNSLNGEVNPWLTCTDQTELLVRSENILTIVEPKKDILKSYLETIS